MSTNNTGRKFFTFLEQYDAVSGLATGLQKANVLSDPNFIDPVYDEVACPIYVPFTVIADRGLSGGTVVLSGGKDNQSILITQNTSSTYTNLIGRDNYTVTIHLINNALSVTVNGQIFPIPQNPLPPAPGYWTFSTQVPIGAITVQITSQPGLWIAGASTCEQLNGLNDGNRTVQTLNEIFSLSGAPTGVSKTNTPGTVGYLAPYQDPTTCPPAQNITLTVDVGLEATTVQAIGQAGQGTFYINIVSGQSGSVRVPNGVYQIAVVVDKSVVDTISANNVTQYTSAPYTGLTNIYFTLGPSDITIIVHKQAVVYSGHEPGSCAADGSGNYTGYEQYPQRDVKYLRSGVLVRTEYNAQDANFINPVVNTTLCPRTTPATLSLTTTTNTGGSIASHSPGGESLTIPDNTAGTRTVAIARPQANNDTVTVTVPKASVASVTIAGITQTVNPGTTGVAALTFGSIPGGNISGTITSQLPGYVGINPVCEQGISKTLTAGTAPINVAYWTNGTLRRMYVVNNQSSFVSVFDCITQTKLGDISIPSLTNGRGICITGAHNQVAVTSQTGSIYIIDPLLSSYGGVANTNSTTISYSVMCAYVPVWDAVVIADANGNQLALMNPLTGALVQLITVGDSCYSVAQVSGSQVWVGNSSGGVIQINAATKVVGSTIQLEGHTIPGNYMSPFAVDNVFNGVAYIVGTANKTLYTINISTLAVTVTRYTASLDRPLFISQRNKLYLSANEGTAPNNAGRIYEVETTGFTITNNLYLGIGTRPLYFAYDPISDTIYVTNLGLIGAYNTTVLVLTPGTHTGRKVYTQLQLVFTGSGVPVSPVTIKNNAQGDPDYIAPFTDASCS